MSHVAEISLSKEERRPGQQPYSSDVRWASVKVIVHPGEDLDDAIQQAHNALTRAFVNAPLQRGVPNDKPPTTTDAAPAGVEVRVKGAPYERGEFKVIGFRWDKTEYTRSFPSSAEAHTFVKTTPTLKGRDVTISGGKA